MPFSDHYCAMVLPRCDCGCGGSAVLSELGAAEQAVILPVRCSASGRRRLLKYDPVTLSYQTMVASAGTITTLGHYPCSGNCGFCAPLEHVDTGHRFLRLHYKCKLCRHIFGRFYSIEEKGYVLLPRPVRPARNRQLEGWGKFRGQERIVEDGCVRFSNPSDYRSLFEEALGPRSGETSSPGGW